MVRPYHDAKASLYDDSLRNCQLLSVLPSAASLKRSLSLTQSTRQPMHPQIAAYWSARCSLSHARRAG